MINLCIKRYPQLAVCRDDIQQAIDILIACYEKGGKLLVCGNGGSSTDAEHIVGGLMKGFLKKRPLLEEKRAKMCRRRLVCWTVSKKDCLPFRCRRLWD